MLAQRVGYLCSNPRCQRQTSGPQSDPSGAINIGVAAHITAAAEGGPRYNPDLSREERKSAENAIWLCQTCAKLVDNDEILYTTELLHEWKVTAEARAKKAIASGRYLWERESERSSFLVLANQYDELASRYSDEIDNSIENWRRAWREGRRDEAVQAVEEVKNDKWEILKPELKAKILRFEASLVLSLGNVDLAEELADEALAIFPSDNQVRLRALIAFRKQDPTAAIELLMEEKDYESRNLRAAFYLEEGRVDDALLELPASNEGIEQANSIVQKAETYRLKSFAFLMRKDSAKADLEIIKALEIEPLCVSTQYSYAVIKYFSAISDFAIPERLAGWPEPLDWSKIKSDDESLTKLREAEKIFKRLAELENDKNDEEKQHIKTWRLACLLNDPDKQDEALNYCKEIIEETPTHLGAISWSVTRNLDIDLLQSVSALNELIKENKAKITDVLGLLCCYIAIMKTYNSIYLFSKILIYCILES